jgi:hypothetical protein
MKGVSVLFSPQTQRAGRIDRGSVPQRIARQSRSLITFWPTVSTNQRFRAVRCARSAAGARDLIEPFSKAQAATQLR